MPTTEKPKFKIKQVVCKIEMLLFNTSYQKLDLKI